eukprot:TRINITY_DN7118_c0_g1_i1.p1 TRINITY_DN7118_c0_g1~~TRINITY_DN7118_c0_g1_i1.p1  ORF type:complete len:178 (-),score=35.86 TRINITY_DN7118_c0_g1_i1:217-687(-)
MDGSAYEYLNMEMMDYIQRTSKDSQEVFKKLDNIGFRVGYCLIERYTKDRHRFTEMLEIMKFICREFWTGIFKKQIDNLKTNHKGVYVLHDERFPWLAHLSTCTGSGKTAQEMAYTYVVFPCGLIKGALSNLGVAANVTVEVELPQQCTFTIKLKT